MTEAYLRLHKPARSQFRSPRRARPTGLTVLHTAENVMDTVSVDTGAENVADFIRRRDTPGSYHDLVDSDSDVHLVRYADEAYQDGTGSNPFAMSISFACRTTDWPKMSATRRRAFLRQGARVFLRQQAWLKSKGYPTTPLRLVTKAQSDAGAAGFIYHGHRDPGRRTDPGLTQFPINEFFAIIREEMQEDDDMFTDEDRALLRQAAKYADAKNSDILEATRKTNATLDRYLRGDTLEVLQIVRVLAAVSGLSVEQIAAVGSKALGRPVNPADIQGLLDVAGEHGDLPSPLSSDDIVEVKVSVEGPARA